MKIFRSLTVKLILSFLSLILLTTGLTFFYTLQQARNAIDDGMRDQLESVASVMASQVNGNIIANLKPGDESTPAFQQIRQLIFNMRKSNPDIKYGYIMRPTSTGLEFVVDDTYGIASDAAHIGDPYTSDNPDTAQQDATEILSGLKGPAASSQLYTDKWGTFLSGYAPIIDSNGNSVAILGVDMTASNVLAREKFLTNSLIFVVVGALTLAIILIIWFSLGISRDIRKINEMIENLSKTNTSRTETLAPLMKRKDELGELAKNATEMVEGNVRKSLYSSNFFGKM